MNTQSYPQLLRRGNIQQSERRRGDGGPIRMTACMHGSGTGPKWARWGWWVSWEFSKSQNCMLLGCTIIKLLLSKHSLVLQALRDVVMDWNSWKCMEQYHRLITVWLTYCHSRTSVCACKDKVGSKCIQIKVIYLLPGTRKKFNQVQAGLQELLVCMRFRLIQFQPAHPRSVVPPAQGRYRWLPSPQTLAGDPRHAWSHLTPQRSSRQCSRHLPGPRTGAWVWRTPCCIGNTDWNVYISITSACWG